VRALPVALGEPLAGQMLPSVATGFDDTISQYPYDPAGPKAIIDENPRRDAARKQARLTEALAQRASGCRYAENVRYRERSNVERVNGRLKDEFGGRHVRVRGHAKVMCHLMFGIVALTVDQLLRMLN